MLLLQPQQHTWRLAATSTILCLAFPRTNVHQLIGIWVVSTFWLSWMMLLRTFMYKFLRRSIFVFILGICLVEFLDHMVMLTFSILSRLACPSQIILRLTTCNPYHRCKLWRKQGGRGNVVSCQGPQLRAVEMSRNKEELWSGLRRCCSGCKPRI